jgi:hypothetical protein
MSKLLIVALCALIAADAGAHDCRQDAQSGAHCPMLPMIAVVDDTHETKPPEVIRIEPEDPTEAVPKSFTAPVPTAPATSTAMTCVTPKRQLRTPRLRLDRSDLFVPKQDHPRVWNSAVRLTARIRSSSPKISGVPAEPQRKF